MKRIIRIIQVTCMDCLGTGNHLYGNPCRPCNGSGEVDKRVVELVPDDTDEQAHTMLRNSGDLGGAL